jgi:hypothetical protein
MQSSLNLNSPEGDITSFDRFVQILLSMGQRDKPGFELGGGKVNSLLHHLDKEPGKSFGIALFGCVVVLDRTLRKKECE